MSKVISKLWTQQVLNKKNFFSVLWMLCIILLIVLILSGILAKSNFQVWIDKCKITQWNQCIKMQSSMAVFLHTKKCLVFSHLCLAEQSNIRSTPSISCLLLLNHFIVLFLDKVLLKCHRCHAVKWNSEKTEGFCLCH